MEKITEHKALDALYSHFLRMIYDDFGRQRGAATTITSHTGDKNYISVELEDGQVIKYFVEVSKN